MSEAAARRLEQLRQELIGASPPADEPLLSDGRGPSDDSDPLVEFGLVDHDQEFAESVLARGEAGAAGVVVVDPAVVPPPGRHARERRIRPADLAAGWVQDRLPTPLGERVRISARHLPVLVLLAGLGLVAAGWFALRSGETQPVPVARRGVAGGAVHAVGSSGLPAVPAVPATSPSPAGTVVVDVSGKVRHPGIVTLPAGSRVYDALARAGGVRHGVSLTALNQARLLVDGEQILVGLRAPAGVAPAAAGSTPATDLVNLNTATESQLEELPGVGPVTAQKILDWRTAHGRFSAVDELLEVDGIGEKTLAQIAPHATL